MRFWAACSTICLVILPFVIWAASSKLPSAIRASPPESSASKSILSNGIFEEFSFLNLAARFKITIISLLIGYWIGLHANENLIEGDRQQFMRGVEFVNGKLKKIITPSIPTGVIKPKTALDEFEHNRPNKEKEGMQAMKDTLDNTELKDLADKVKKQNENI